MTEPFSEQDRVNDNRKKMMSCKDLKENFDDFVDETLDPRLHAQIRQHAASCDACQQLLERERQLRMSVATAT